MKFCVKSKAGKTKNRKKAKKKNKSANVIHFCNKIKYDVCRQPISTCLILIDFNNCFQNVFYQ